MKISVNSNQFKYTKEQIAKIRLTTPVEMRAHYREAANIMKSDIVDTIQRGNSPVKGNTRFKNYSPAYRNAINKGRYSQYGKRVRPVNMKLSGRMLGSIAARVLSNGFVVYFTNFLAKIHSTEGPGGKRNYIRKVAPFNNDSWKTSVLQNAKNFLTDKCIRKVASKLRRI